jgi:chromosomal replication initiation ATPase DnaA
MADCSQYPDSAREIKAEQNSTDIDALMAEVVTLRARLALLKLDGPKPMMRDIIAAVAQVSGTTSADIQAGWRSRSIDPIRQRAMRMCHDAGHTYSAIARMFGGRNHTTIRHGVAADRRRAP